MVKHFVRVSRNSSVPIWRCHCSTLPMSVSSLAAWMGWARWQKTTHPWPGTLRRLEQPLTSHKSRNSSYENPRFEGFSPNRSVKSLSEPRVLIVSAVLKSLQDFLLGPAPVLVKLCDPDKRPPATIVMTLSTDGSSDPPLAVDMVTGLEGKLSANEAVRKAALKSVCRLVAWLQLFTLGLLSGYPRATLGSPSATLGSLSGSPSDAFSPPTSVGFRPPRSGHPRPPSGYP